MIRVVQISTHETSGGAALAARRLHVALLAQGDVASTMFVGLAQDHGEGVREYNPAWPGPRALGRVLFRAGRRLNRRDKTVAGLLFSPGRTSFGRAPCRQIPPADLYHLHWTADLVDLRMLPLLARRAPVVWTLHDMNPFTGGCHYDGECGRFRTRCGSCPVLASPQPEDASAAGLRRKLAILSALPDDALTVIAPSRWLAGESRRSAAFGRFETRVIPNGIDLDEFRPVDRAAARRRLGLAAADRVMLFVADSLDDTRKGWAELQQALGALMPLPGLRVVTLGHGDVRQMTDPVFRHLGQLSDVAAIRDAYNAADVFVIPSLQDNLPNTLLESLACGTPVVGFSSGGIADAVEHGVCGLLAATRDTAELATHVRRVLTDDPLRADMAAAARDRAVALYGWERQAQACRDLYGELLELRRPPGPVGAVPVGLSPSDSLRSLAL